jgi:fatty acid desaturase
MAVSQLQDEMGQDEDVSPAQQIDRAAMLGERPLSDFNGRTPGYTIGIIVLDLLLIVAVAALCEAFWSPLAYILAVMFIGARQVGIATIVLHDGVHGLLLKNRKHNDRFAKVVCWLVLVPLVEDFDGFRKIHLGHHRRVNEPDDPDLPILDYVYSATTARVMATPLLCFSGVVFARYLRRYMSASWQRKAGVLLAVAGLGTGLWFSVRGCELFVLYYLIPFATWGMFVNLVRVSVEHYPAGSYGRPSNLTGVILTRETIPSWFDKLFVVTRNLNYHFTHHMFPSVSFRRLAELQRHLARSAAYREVAHVCHGYHRAVAEMLQRSAS